jgi:hypothetical protein
MWKPGKREPQGGMWMAVEVPHLCLMHCSDSLTEIKDAARSTAGNTELGP